MDKTSYVIAVSGPSGSGKTSIVKALSERLEGTAALYFDDYAAFHRFPEDGMSWLTNGADPKMVINEPFYNDLMQLITGHPIHTPNTNQLVNPAKFVIIEEPFGRGRQGMEQAVDFVVCLDTPLEVSLARRLLEWAKSDQDSSEHTVQKIEGYLTQYLMGVKDLYRIVNEGVKGNCDLILNGLAPTEEMVKDIVEALNRMLALK